MNITRRRFAQALLAGTLLSRFPAIAAERSRPNIITIVLDDVGYSDLGCYGSEILTPAMDRLAREGLRFLHFDTKAICSSTRAAFLTGRNSHTVNMPTVPDFAPFMDKAEGARLFRIPENAWNMAQVLQREGYATWALGKWHLLPQSEHGPHAGRASWPRHRGFDYFYGFPGGWTDQYRPELVENDNYITPDLPRGYHLSVDLVDKAATLLLHHAELECAKPFFLNLAFGAAHAPMQVPRAYSRRYDAVYAKGWDLVRSTRFARMKAMGIVPDATLLPERASDDRAWDDLTADEKTLFARYMAVYAGFLEHCDEQIGRLLDTLDNLKLADNTIVILFSDNGAAAEGGAEGRFERLYQPGHVPVTEQVRRIDEIGSPTSQPEYQRPWAWAGDTPFRRYKTWPYAGGVRTPMIMRWPRRIVDPGGMRNQFVDVVDVAPTLLEAAGTAFPRQVAGSQQIPIAGQSFLPMLSVSDARGRRTQYFELHGKRAITDGRWRAIANHTCGISPDEDRWELYDLATDFSESNDIGASNPQKLDELKRLWASESRTYGVVPLKNFKLCF